MAVLSQAKPVSANPAELVDVAAGKASVDEQYYMGHITYRELALERGLLKREPLMDRLVRYFLMGSTGRQTVTPLAGAREPSE